MIVRRKRPRMVVKRNRTTVGERQRAIVRRSGGGVTPPPGNRSGRQWRWPIGRWGMVAIASGVATIALVGGGVWAWQSPLFEINHIEVRGNEKVTKDAIVERADLFGESIFDADLGKAQRDLYGIPLVSSVTVERKWPNTVRITVEERQAWGTWEQGGVKYTIDREGVILGTSPTAQGSPVIRSSEVGSRIQGDRVDYQAVDAAAEIYERLPRQLGTTVTEVAFIAGKGVQVTTASGETALFGDSSSIAYKLSVWAALSQQAGVQGINYTTIDLRYGNRPVLQ